MNHEPIYEIIEVLSTDKGALQQAARDGYTQYGLSKMRDEVTLKLRREVENQKRARS